MAQTGYTPIRIYYSATTTNVPLAANLAAGELAINTADGKLFYKDSSNVVQVIGTKGGVGSSSTTQVLYNSSGLVVGSGNLTFDGTTLTAGGLSGPHNGTVGATTPATGAFTTLSTSSTVTLSGGTANGVAYLNGSKAVTTGSALTFDGTNLGVSGFAAAANFYTPLTVFGLGTSDNSATIVGYGGTGSGGTTNTFVFRTGGSERMRLDASGNLGLGVTPSAWAGGFKPLQILQSALAAYNDGAGNIQTEINTNAYQDTLGTYKYIVNGGAVQYRQLVGLGAHVWNQAAAGTAGGTITFNQLMTLDSSGNLGVGTSSPGYKLDVSTAATTGARITTAEYGQLVVSDGTRTTYIQNYAGAGAIGTATNNKLVFTTNSTDRMTLDTSGNLGLGATPSAWHSSFKAVEGPAYGSGWLAVAAGAITVAGNAYQVSAGGTSWQYKTTNLASRYDTVNGVHYWYTAPSGTAGNAITFTQAMTLNASGILLVGTTSASGSNKLQVSTDALINGMTVGRGGNNVALNTAVGYTALNANAGGFQNVAVGYNSMPANTEGAHNVAVGYNTLLSNITGGSNTAIGENVLYSNTGGVQNTAVGLSSMYANISGSYNTAIGSGTLVNSTGSGNVMVGARSSSGTFAPVFDPTTESNRLCMGSTAVTNAYVQVSWTVVSDARDKTDFAPVPHGLAFVTKLKPTAYRYKIDREANEGHGPLRYGFKAQDVLALEGDIPVIVDADDLEKLRFNDQSMIAVLVNAIQELKAEFDAYKVAHP